MTTAVGFADDGGAVRQITPHWNLGLVAASIAVSLIGAFTSAQLVCYARSATSFLGVLVWTILSSFVFGFCAVFCLHEIATLACELDVPVGIDPAWTVVSAMLAIVFAFAALAGVTFKEFYSDERRREMRHRLADASLGHVELKTSRRASGTGPNLAPGRVVSVATFDWGIHNAGNSHDAVSETDDTTPGTQSDADLLDEDQAYLLSRDARSRRSSLAALATHGIMPLLSNAASSSAGLESQNSMAPDAFNALQTSATSRTNRLPRARQPSWTRSNNPFVATVATIYTGLTIENIVKGLLWSLSLTSMHYSGMLGLNIPDGFIVFNPVLVLLAATICWNVCIVGAICMENMTEMLAQQLLFSVVATSGCAALHWTGMWSATFMTSAPPSDKRGYPIALPFLVGIIATVTCLAANILLVHNATISRNRLAEFVSTREELWRAIAQKESAEAAALARSEFIASASHEIRTPLHHLQGYGDLLARRGDLSDEARTLLQSIQGATKTLSCITNNVLDWSKIENDKSEYNATTFDIRSACESVVYLLPHQDEEADVDVFVVVTPVVPQHVFLDEGYLNRIIMNLLSNAIKFTKYGFILLVVDLIQNDLVISVKDTGHGMPAAFLPVMFQPFKQAKSHAMSRGTGLGLSIIKQLVHDMHGTIQVESQYENDVGEDESGTTITATIPLPKLVASVDEDILQAQTDSFPQVAILETRHNPRALEGLQLAWEKFGCRATIMKPVNFARAIQASNSRWDYVVADISILEQDRSLLPVMRKSDALAVLVPYNEQRDLHKLPSLDAPLTPLRKPLVWHTFEARTAAAKEMPTETAGSIASTSDANMTVAENKVASSRQGDQKTYTVLLVEDNLINQKLGKKMLESLGYNVLLAEDGEIAIEQLQRYDKVIDLVLMDQSMPRKDGVAATREIRAMEAAGVFSRMPRMIIAVTAGVGPHAQAMCREAGMDDFLTKPLSLTKLEDVLSTVLPP